MAAFNALGLASAGLDCVRVNTPLRVMGPLGEPRPIKGDANPPALPNDPEGLADRGEFSRRDEPMVAARVKGELPGARMVAERVRMGRCGVGVSGGVMGPFDAFVVVGERVSERDGVDCKARRVDGRVVGVGGDISWAVAVGADVGEAFSESAVWRVRLPVGAIIFE
jgi:hypothetical protein